jgi:deoxyribonuclease V
VWDLKAPHSFRVTPKEAAGIQRELAALVEIGRPAKDLRLIAGVDAAFSSDGGCAFGGVVVWDLESACAVESHAAEAEIPMPYVPGLLSFRELPALLSALRGLSRKPDAVMCDGQGIAHPRRLGLASHLGVIAEVPAVGCAKSRLCGDHSEPGPLRGDRAPLMMNGERIGTVLRTRDHTKPLYVSIGHKMDLTTAEELVLRCGAGCRLPEPVRQAHRLVADRKKQGER